MRRFRSWLMLVAMAGAGCSVAPARIPDAPTAWVAEHGGPSAVTLPPGTSAAVRCLEDAGAHPLARVLVAAEPRIGAWSWPDRTIVVTEKLVGSLDDEELAAAVAHEMGHLDLGAEPRPAALAGAERAAAEVAADRRGAALLAVSGLDPAAMPRMLRKVAALVGPTTAAGRAATARAERLEGVARSAPAAQAGGTTPRCWR